MEKPPLEKQARSCGTSAGDQPNQSSIGSSAPLLLNLDSVTPYESLIDECSPFGLFVMEHYLRCRGKLWDQEKGLADNWNALIAIQQFELINYLWGQLYQRCHSVWTLMRQEEHVRFYALSVSFKSISDEARTMGKRLVGVLHNDRLSFDLEETTQPMRFSPMLYTPLLPGSFRQAPPNNKPELRTVSTMTDPVTVTPSTFFLVGQDNTALPSVEGERDTGVDKKPLKKRKIKKKVVRKSRRGRKSSTGGVGKDSEGSSGGKDHVLPKRIRSAYMMFMASEGAKRWTSWKGDFQGRDDDHGVQESGAFGRYMGQLWKSMSDKEKEPFNEMCRQDKQRYNREVSVQEQSHDSEPPVDTAHAEASTYPFGLSQHAGPTRDKKGAFSAGSGDPVSSSEPPTPSASANNALPLYKPRKRLRLKAAAAAEAGSCTSPSLPPKKAGTSSDGTGAFTPLSFPSETATASAAPNNDLSLYKPRKRLHFKAAAAANAGSCTSPSLPSKQAGISSDGTGAFTTLCFPSETATSSALNAPAEVATTSTAGPPPQKDCPVCFLPVDQKDSCKHLQCEVLLKWRLQRAEEHISAPKPYFYSELDF